MSETFIDSLGIFGDIASMSYTVTVYSSTDGHDAILPLATSTAVVGGAGAQFYDIPLTFTFLPGTFYALAWAPTVTNFTWGELSYYYNSVLPETVGPFSVIDGASGNSPANFNFTNLFNPRLRVNVVTGVNVPEPGTLWLFASGVAALVKAGRRSRDRGRSPSDACAGRTLRRR